MRVGRCVGERGYIAVNAPPLLRTHHECADDSLRTGGGGEGVRQGGRCVSGLLVVWRKVFVHVRMRACVFACVYVYVYVCMRACLCCSACLSLYRELTARPQTTHLATVPSFLLLQMPQRQSSPPYAHTPAHTHTHIHTHSHTHALTVMATHPPTHTPIHTHAHTHLSLIHI